MKTFRQQFSCMAFYIAFTLLSIVAPVQGSEVVQNTLQNGLRVIIIRNTLAPAAAIQLNYLVGSVESPTGFPGMAHALEHMMFRGSPQLSADQLSTIIAATGGGFNADTQQTVTQYLSTIAVEDLETSLHVEAVRMQGILDSQEEWNQERGAIEQEVQQDLSNPEYLMSVRLQENLFANSPYEHDALGTHSSFEQTTPAMLQKFYRDWYAPNNAILVIVGDVDPARTMTTVKKLFGSIPARTLPPRPVVALQPLKPAIIKLDSNLPYGLAVVAYRLPGYESPDYAASQVLSDVLASQRGNLYALVPEGKALLSGFEGMTLLKSGAGFVTAAFPQGKDGEALIASLKQIIADYIKNGIPPELVTAAKLHEIADVEFQKNSISGLASVWSQSVAVEGRNSPDDDVEAIRKVTVDDVNRIARSYLVNDTAITAVLIPQPSGKPIASKGSSRSKESFVSKNIKPVTLPDWAVKLTRSLPKDVRNKKPSDIRLPNGLRLIVVPTTISDSIGVYGEVKNTPSLQTPAGKEGVNDLLDGLFSYGTTSLDRLAYQTALDEIAADVSTGTSFSLNVLKAHFTRGVELLADNLLHPALPEQAFKVVQSETADALVGKLQSPAWLAGQALHKGLFPAKDPSLRHATPDSVAALTLNDVIKYHRAAFRPDLTTIIVIGAVTPATAKEVIEKYFGNWRVIGPKPATELPRVPLNKPTTVSVPDKSRVQDEVTLAETVGITRKHSDYYPLQVGLHVLSGGFYATRLYRDLRERTGLVYTVEAFLHAGNSRSLIEFYYGCDPNNVTRARELIERNLDKMRRKPVLPAELHQAKTLLLRNILLTRTSTNSIASQLLSLTKSGLPLDEPDKAARHYRAITEDQVKKAFARWLRLSDFVQVTRGPAPL